MSNNLPDSSLSTSDAAQRFCAEHVELIRDLLELAFISGAAWGRERFKLDVKETLTMLKADAREV